MIYAVDFDGTIMTHDKKANINLINFLIGMQRKGAAVILNTCRQGKKLSEAVIFCNNYGLTFQAVNETYLM